MSLKTQFIAVFIAICISSAYAKKDQSDRIKIGGLFDENSKDSELAFRFGVQAINNQRNKQTDGLLEAVTKRIQYGNAFQASQQLCKMMKNGVSGVVHGSTSTETAIHVQNICDTKEMPLLETRFDPYTEQPIINLHPHPEVLAKLFLEMVEAWEWESFTIIYENAPWLPLMHELLKKYDSKGFTVTVRQLDLTDNENYRPQLRRVKHSDDKNVIISCSIEALPEILKQTQQVGLLTEEHQFIIACLDMHTIDLEPFQHSGANITGVRLINPEDPMVVQVTNFFADKYVEKMEREKQKQSKENQDNKEDNDDDDADGKENEEDDDEDDEIEVPDGLTAENIRVDSALAYDAVLLFSEVVKIEGGVKTKNIKCDDDSGLRTHGISDSMAMKTIPVRGLSGDIQFDQKGHRSNFQVEIIELATDGIRKIGTWNTSDGLYLARAHPAVDDSVLSLRNKTFVVLTALSAPYGMLKETHLALLGNDRFEGFGIELIQKLSEKLGFNYTFRLQEDGAYGSLNKETGEWNGMIRELMDDRADLAITDLTITSDREGAADFTMPFMNLGISILFEKPKKEPPQLFSFMSPFSSEVWMYLGTALFLVSLSLFVMGRLSPAEWDNPYPCIEEPEVLENQFSFQNSVWFSLGALLQQGSEIAPKAPSTRIVASMWWFFTLIMVSSYTANLAAFLTIESLSSPIDNVEDLANADGVVPYGAKRGGSTFGFFKESENPTYQKMYEFMSTHPEHMTATNDEGLERAKAGKYAFLMESSSIEYIIERNCEVTQVGGELDAKGYGIAMKKNSPYRGALSEAVLQMQESGEITQMKIKWWKEKRGGGACTDTADDGGAEELTVANVGGVFAVLISGGAIGVIVCMFEMLYDVWNRAKELEIPFMQEFVDEIRFIIKCNGNTKIVTHKKSQSRRISIEPESRSPSRTSYSPSRDMTAAGPYGFRPSLKNLEKLDLMPEHEVSASDDHV